MQLVAPALKAGVAVNPGAAWATDAVTARNYLRLCYAVLADEGITTLAQVFHPQGCAAGGGMVSLPDTLERKYPNANRDWGGSISFPQPSCRALRAQESYGDTMCMNSSCNGWSIRQSATLV